MPMSIARSPPPPALTAGFQDFITRYAWGEIWTRPGLDRRTRSCITLTALVAGGHHEELALHVRGAVRNGLTPARSAKYCSRPPCIAAFPPPTRRSPSRTASRVRSTRREVQLAPAPTGTSPPLHAHHRRHHRRRPRRSAPGPPPASAPESTRVVLEARDREYVEQRQRAGILEQTTVDALRAAGAGERMDREGLVHTASSSASTAARTASTSRPWPAAAASWSTRRPRSSKT